MDFFLYEVSFVVDAVGEYVQPGFNVRVHLVNLLLFWYEQGGWSHGLGVKRGKKSQSGMG